MNETPLAPPSTVDRSAPEEDEPAPSPNAELVCTLCGLSACWTPKPPKGPA